MLSIDLIYLDVFFYIDLMFIEYSLFFIIIVVKMFVSIFCYDLNLFFLDDDY